ncbi:MAG: crossover junction endodeoxyribonuclease RuvC [Candidatus Pacebacteria bacterium]|nr:crossover junction endodeoxyribonuclease RuvC [Candidatus Paceibacterota bacterium]
MIILGIDPGTATTGYGVIDNLVEGKKKFKHIENGIIKTPPTASAPDRLCMINAQLVKIIKKHSPEILVLEKLFFFRNLKTALPVSQAIGVVMFTAAKNKLPIFQFTPLQVKLIVTGFGKAEKKEVQKRITKILKLKEIPKPDDAADALAVALAFCLKKETV